MARPRRWTSLSLNHGLWEIKLSSWKWLHDFVHQEMLEYEHYVWRGQRNEKWILESTFERETTGRSISSKTEILEDHLDSFKYAVRGRRGINPSELESENDWWSLGQHHGLSTPLLDWTHSPFVALYFAFHNNTPPQSRNRVVYAVNPSTIEFMSEQVAEERGDMNLHCEFVRPLADDNPRLVNQGGLFRRTPIGVDLETWLKKVYESEFSEGVLLKIIIPNTGRAECLKTLNRMNINHSTLFPDIFGSSEYCNTKLRISKY